MRARQLDQPREDHPAHAAAAVVAIDVDREVHDIAIRLARIELVQAAPSGDVAGGLGYDHGIARAFRGKPRGSFVGGAKLRL